MGWGSNGDGFSLEIRIYSWTLMSFVSRHNVSTDMIPPVTSLSF